MIESLLQQCKEQRTAVEQARVTLLVENQFQTIDFLTVGWVLQALSRGHKVTFLAFRENYAHFLSLSKKVGKSIEGYLKTEQLIFVECFQSEFCSELPLLETQPATYVPPPSSVKKMLARELLTWPSLGAGCDLLAVDAVAYIEDRPELPLCIYQKALQNGCKLLLAGCAGHSQLTGLLEEQSTVKLVLEPEVGGFGKLAVSSQGGKSVVLFRTQKGQVEFRQQILI